MKPPFLICPSLTRSRRRRTVSIGSSGATAVRGLTVPIADNPFGCVGYTTKAGETIIRNREHYTAKVDFIDGNVSMQSPTIAASEANAAEALANAMGGVAVRNAPAETYYAQAAVPRALGCVAPAGAPAPAARYAHANRDYYLTFTRTTVRISSREDDAIRTTVETWADAVPALA